MATGHELMLREIIAGRNDENFIIMLFRLVLALNCGLVLGLVRRHAQNKGLHKAIFKQKPCIALYWFHSHCLVNPMFALYCLYLGLYCFFSLLFFLINIVISFRL